MLSDSTGYGSSTGSASIYSPCMGLPPTTDDSLAMLYFQKSRNLAKLKPLQFSENISNERAFDCYYLESRNVPKAAEITRYSKESCFSDFPSDSDYLEDPEAFVYHCENYDDQDSVDTGQSRFYGADVFDENQYDQCPNELGLDLQSQFSSKRNTAPFASPVTFLDENVGFLLPQESDPNLKLTTPLVEAKIVRVKHRIEPPSCTPFGQQGSPFEEQRRSLLQDSSEYHRGNSIRLRTMPLPLRASIVVTKPFEPKCTSVLVQPNESFVQNIQIGTPAGTITRSYEKSSIASQISCESSLTRTSIREDGHVEEEEDFYTISPLKSANKSLHSTESLKPPPKPPRGRMVATSLSFLEKGISPTKSGPTKRLSINTSSAETFFFNKRDKIIPKASVKIGNEAASLFAPKKSILKNTLQQNFEPMDPNKALFGPIEHIYETIDSDPSSTSSDDDRSSIAQSHARPVSFASSSSNTVSTDIKPKKLMPDLRPAVPTRPFCWPFTLFPPDMTFCPRSLHAYHRKPSVEKGQVPYYAANIRKTEVSFDPYPYPKETIKLIPVTKKISRMPSLLSKVV